MHTLRRRPKAGISGALEAVLLIMIVVVAVGLVAVYYFRLIGSSQTKTGLQILNAQLSGGVLTLTVQNTGSVAITSLSISVTTLTTGAGGTMTPTTVTSTTPSAATGVLITPGGSASYTVTIPNAQPGTTYTVILQATYTNGATYTYQTQVVAQ